MSRGQRTVQSSAWRRRVQGTSRACARQVQSQAGGGLVSPRQKSSARSTYSSWGALEERGAWSFSLCLRTLWGSVRVREMRRHGAQQKNTPMKRKAVVAVLASEGLALVSVSARTTSSVVVVPTPTDPMEFHKITRDLKARSAEKEHSNEVRGGGRDPGVGRPGAGPGRSPARSKFVRSFHF